MPSNPNKLSQFWHELKRRKVLRVITVYAAVAFVILQLVEILAPSLRLPEWTMNLILVLLIVGFIIAVILSWIYDIQPEGGIMKTEPASKVKTEDVPKISNSWKIASYISFVVIVGLIVLNIIPRSNNKKNLEKSIAVLPLEYLSEDPNKEYLANAVLDAITGHLSKIEGLRVMPRTSVEQYRENKKSAREIGEELNVSYLIEGSFLMIGDQVKLTIQLVVANEGDHVFFEEYDRKYKDIFIVQSEVARTIANEIELAITPKEIELIEKIPTASLTAYDFYTRGYDKLISWWVEGDVVSLNEAEDLFNEAIEYDSTYAEAYAGLAWVYRRKSVSMDSYLSEDYMDSVKILADLALTYDRRLPIAYEVKGYYYMQIGKFELSLEELEKAIKYNPNYWQAYWTIGDVYHRLEKFDLAIQNYSHASLLHRGKVLPILFRSLASTYQIIGFEEEAVNYFYKVLDLDGDSVSFLIALAVVEANHGNPMEAVTYLQKAYSIDTSDFRTNDRLAWNYMRLEQFAKSLEYFKKAAKIYEDIMFVDDYELHRRGYVYWQNGYEQEAKSLFNKKIEINNKLNKLKRPGSITRYNYYDLAAVYAFLGENEKAFENLRLFNKKQKIPHWMISLIHFDPLFDKIRNEPEFQQIVRDLEDKYQTEHERIRKSLEENDMF